MEKEIIEIESAPAKKSYKNWIFISLIILLLIVIVIALAYLGYDYFSNKIEPNETEQNDSYINDTTPINDSKINDTLKPVSLCGNNKCDAKENYTNCPNDCKRPTTGGGSSPSGGSQNSCTPNCNNKQCGDNGCSGSCGSCNSSQYCNATQQCVENPANCVHDEGCSAFGSFCQGNVPYNCALGSNGCFDRVNLTSCPSGYQCVNGTGCEEIRECTADANCTYLNNTCSSGFCSLSGKCEVSFNSSSTVCRNNLSECDAQEFCLGNNANCPVDSNKTNGTSCLIGTCQNGKCEVGCTETCISLGYQCGIQQICGQPQNCGSCTSGTCNASGKCVVTCTNDAGCSAFGSFCQGNMPYNCTLGSDGCLDRVNKTACRSGQYCSVGQCFERIITGGLIADHNAANDFDKIPDYWLNKTKQLTLQYAHRSDGNQILEGAAFLNNVDPVRYRFLERDVSTGGLAALPAQVNPPALRLMDGNPPLNAYSTPDLYWDSESGRNATINNAATGLFNFSMWSWCNELADSHWTTNWIQSYLNQIDSFEKQFPNMRFIYHTGFTDNIDTINVADNEYIRNYTINNNKILYDFEDIGEYDPNGNYYPDADRACTWCATWCTNHPSDCSNLPASCSHSEGQGRFICIQRGKAFWWLMARLAGWDGTPKCPDYTTCSLDETCQQGICVKNRADISISLLPSLVRINQTTSIGNEKNITIYAAGGEYESFQIAIRAENEALSNVSIQWSDLISNTGQTISKPNFTLYREHYIYVHSSPNNIDAINKPLGTGWYPDGLIPFNDPVTGEDLSGATLDAVPFSVSAGQNQVIWVDVYVPRGTDSRDYHSNFTIISDQGTSTVDVTLHAWGFDLPKQPSLKTLFGISMSSETAAGAANLFEAMKEMSRHKIYPERLTGPDNHIYPSIANQKVLVDKYGMSQTILPYWADASPSSGYMRSPPTLSAIQTQLTRYSPDLEPICYPLDEPGSNAPNIYSGIIQWGSRFHEAGIRQLITMPPVTALFDDGRGTGQSAVDIWVILPFQYDASKNLVDQAMNKGDEVWSYNGLVQDLYSPKWEIDFVPINYRIQPGFISQNLNLTGLLYWRVDYWSSDPWNNADNAGHWSANNYPGEGMLVYPGTQVGLPGVVPSMRLKYLRDGVDDYEYIQLLKNLGEKDWALSQAEIVGKNWSNWTRDPKILESQRIVLGKEIERLNFVSLELSNKNKTNIFTEFWDWLKSFFS